jgi:hypothetical protein
VVFLFPYKHCGKKYSGSFFGKLPVFAIKA